MATVNCIKCSKCKTIIYSRAHYDFRTCPCGAVFVDGGNDYMRIGWHADKISKPKVFKKRLSVGWKTLYDDWNTSTDKYGYIKDKKHGK